MIDAGETSAWRFEGFSRLFTLPVTGYGAFVRGECFSNQGPLVASRVLLTI
jgi:hypothetical protein